MNIETVFLNTDLNIKIYMKMSDEMNNYIKKIL